MKRFGAHFLGGSTGLEKSQLGFSPELPSSGPQPKARHPEVQLAGQNPCAVLGATPLIGAEHQTCTGSVWFICSRMSWILLRIFFWWPAKVTPILSRSLETEKKKRYSVPSPLPATPGSARAPAQSLHLEGYTYSAVIWATRSKDANPALTKLSLYLPILMASSQSPTVVKVV